AGGTSTTGSSGRTAFSGRSAPARFSFPSSTRFFRRRATSGIAKSRRQLRAITNSQPQLKEAVMLKRSFILITTLFIAAQAHAFCGFYVAKGDTKIFNRASQVVIVRDQDRTVMTMANDFQGSARDFAVVIPIPTKIERGQIHVADKALIDHLDAYSSPRLVEYFDPDPCAPPERPVLMAPTAAMEA